MVATRLVLQLTGVVEPGWILERTTSLSDPVWLPVADLSPGQTEVTVALDPDQPQGFYRIRSSP